MRPELDVVMPPGIAERPRDRRGYPIPFVSFMDDEGTPDFTVIDSRRVLECVMGRLCGLCGQEMGYWVAFIGGPLSMKNRVVNDPPMHLECAEYAVAVCPYLALEGTTYSKRGHNRRVLAQGQTLSKPPVSCLAVTRRYGFNPETYLIKFGPPREVRVYPYESHGSWYIPDPVTWGGLVSESERRARELHEENRRVHHQQWLADRGAR